MQPFQSVISVIREADWNPTFVELKRSVVLPNSFMLAGEAFKNKIILLFCKLKISFIPWRAVNYHDLLNLRPTRVVGCKVLPCWVYGCCGALKRVFDISRWNRSKGCSSLLIQVVKMFIVVVIIFAVCWLPYHVYFIYTYHDTEIRREESAIILIA